MSDFEPAGIDSLLDLVHYLPAAYQPLLAFVHNNPIVVDNPPFALAFDTVETPPLSPEPQGPAEMDIDEMDIEMGSPVDTPPPSPTPPPFPHPLWGDTDEWGEEEDADFADYDPILQAAIDAEFAPADIVVGWHVG